MALKDFKTLSRPLVSPLMSTSLKKSLWLAGVENVKKRETTHLHRPSQFANCYSFIMLMLSVGNWAVLPKSSSLS